MESRKWKPGTESMKMKPWNEKDIAYDYKFFECKKKLKKGVFAKNKKGCNHSKHREQSHLSADYFGVLSAFYTKRIKK